MTKRFARRRKIHEDEEFHCEVNKMTVSKVRDTVSDPRRRIVKLLRSLCKELKRLPITEVEKTTDDNLCEIPRIKPIPAPRKSKPSVVVRNQVTDNHEETRCGHQKQTPAAQQTPIPAIRTSTLVRVGVSKQLPESEFKTADIKGNELSTTRLVPTPRKSKKIVLTRRPVCDEHGLEPTVTNRTEMR